MKDQFNVDFPIFDKIDVNGPLQHPLYSILKLFDGDIIGSPQTREKISWNFEKFLIDENGNVLRRYKPGIKPLFIEYDISGYIKEHKLPQVKKPSLSDYD
jgi:glutathione peroxidase